MNDNLLEKLNTLPFPALKELAAKFEVKARSRADLSEGIAAAAVSENGVYAEVLSALEANGLSEASDALRVEVLDETEAPTEPASAPEPEKPAEAKPKERRNSLGERYGVKRYNRI